MNILYKIQAGLCFALCYIVIYAHAFLFIKLKSYHLHRACQDQYMAKWDIQSFSRGIKE
jgi:hypothetical protein